MKKYIAILFACVSFCACEDFLTQENPNKIEIGRASCRERV